MGDGESLLFISSIAVMLCSSWRISVSISCDPHVSPVGWAEQGLGPIACGSWHGKSDLKRLARVATLTYGGSGTKRVGPMGTEIPEALRPSQAPEIQPWSPEPMSPLASFLKFSCPRLLQETVEALEKVTGPREEPRS